MSRGTRAWRGLLDGVLAWTLPAVCAAPGCDAPLGNSPTLCPSCWDGILRWIGRRCRLCGTPAPAMLSGCPNCPQSIDADRSLRYVRAATAFGPTARSVIHLFKYGPRPRLAKPLAGLIIDTGPPADDWSAYAAIVPVPLHRVRKAERGFCQATALAKAIRRVVGAPACSGTVVRRVRPTAPMWQTGGLSGRREEIAGAFKADVPTELRGRSFLLVDDVVTTGSTAGEVARALRSAGSGPVDVVCVARAVQLPDGHFDDHPDDPA